MTKTNDLIRLKLNIGGIFLADKTDLVRIINGAANIAVATLTTNGQAPDVRLVLGAYDEATDQVLFISSTQAEKVAEINAHSQAAFATAPVGQGEFVRVRQATVKQITPTAAQAAVYNKKYPDSAKYAAQSAFFALTFKQADVVAGGGMTTVKVAD